MTALSREEQRVALTHGGWALADVLTGRDLPEIHWGGKSLRHDWWPKGAWEEHDRKRIKIVAPLGGPIVAQVTWNQIRDYARTLPKDLTDRMRANSREAHRHAVWAHDNWHYTRAMDVVERWCMDAKVAGHLETVRRIRQVQVDLLNEAFPLAFDDSPDDLLELLAAEGA